ncbi:MAG: hypothetical protein EXS10_10400, partial [Phycisphaerales bacterium]|nr:hypothetical protein [Phycisphaerales bacterium]
QALLAEYREDPPPVGGPPEMSEVAWCIETLRLALFPRLLGRVEASEWLRRTMPELESRFCAQVAAAFRVAHELDADSARGKALACAGTLFTALPSVRALLLTDLDAAYRGDPAATSTDEVLLCYPGFFALTAHRIAHALHLAGVPLLPRMIGEYAHRLTGIDIHPGAQIAAGFFIDHGTGVVIGETTVIGEHCKIYQGVTLGAKSFDREPDGSLRKGYKRHPTLEADVTVYAGATILGGETVIGKGAVIAGGVFLTTSVPAGHIVHGQRPELTLLARGDAL